MSTTHTPTEFLRIASETAEHFGFTSLDTLKKDPVCRNCTAPLLATASAQERRIDALHGLLTAGATSFTESRLHALERPTLFYSFEQVPRSGDAAIAFHVYNVEKSIAESILIQATRALVEDLGFERHHVRINSLGDNDSTTRYTRELTNFLKKRLDLMPVAARELMKEHPLLALMHLVETNDELALKSPNPLEFLSDSSRKHFREIIEYLDMSATPYEIDPKMLGHHDCYSEALFSIDLLDEDYNIAPEAPVIVRGGRYDQFLYRSTKQRIPAAGAVVVLREKKSPARPPRARIGTPSVYVVQLGFGPKIQSLMLINELRKAGVPVLQNLASDSLSAQLRDAEARGVKYTVIVGQKEFVDKTVILRDMEARNQEHVSQPELIRRLKRQVVLAA